MDIGTLLSVIQTLLSALQCSELKDAWSVWGYKSDLDELSSVAATIKKVLLDAEAKYEELSQETLLYIGELRNALYDADDLLDEFVTLVKQRKLMEDDKFSKKVCLFFSRYNQLNVAYNMSQGVKKIVKKLDFIASKHNKFGLNLDHKAIRRRREETCSYPDTEIIGRDDDLEKIVGILLNPVVQSDVSFTTVVGMGGLGKTALAQLVYNHEKIIKEYPLRVWNCVSDHDQSKLDVKTILVQILESATRQKHDGYSMELVVARLREELAQRRFLIVLDDLWTENCDEWRKLVGHLVGGKGGNQVVVTTRSKETAKIVGNGLKYELKGLSDENSWHLFQLLAFEQVLDQVSPYRHDSFISIGKDIVKICANVPLAIRVIGSLLYGQDKSKWLSIRELGLANLREDQNGIKPILKLSYHNLHSPLKSCFSYCSLFPKDFMIKKDMLISLWIAQGYIVPLEKGQSLEDAGEEYFSVLLRRCFFQDIQHDQFGEIFSFKLHDLMHDVALEVAEKEICPASSFAGDMDEAVRHASLMRKQYASYCFAKSHIRTYLHVDALFKDRWTEVPLVTVVTVLAKYRCLRTLDLSYLNIKILPASIGKLIHLRYLDLSHNYNIEVLPKSITKLCNLQTLNLDSCKSLKELPKDLSKLVNLIVLWLFGCDRLTFMPSGLGKLTNLYKLSKFVVGARSSSLKQQLELEALKHLKKLRGSIEIEIHFPKSIAFVKDDNTRREEAYIRDKEHLYRVRFECKHEESNEGATYDQEEVLLDALQPHANLKEMELAGYRCVKMPRWAEENNLDTFLPNLTRLSLFNCSGIQYLSLLGKLCHLKYLTLENLPNLEYIESQLPTASSGEVSRFLPCLEHLRLQELPKLKEWRQRSGKTVGGDIRSISSKKRHQSTFFLSQLENLFIWKCPYLTSLPHCPKIEKLHFFRFNEKLQIIKDPTSYPKLRAVRIDNMAWLSSSLPVESLQCLTHLAVNDNNEVESLTEFAQVLRACSSSLLSLEIRWCHMLRSLSEGLGNLAALESLYLQSLPEVNLTDEEIEGESEDDGMPWGSLCHTLLYLRVSYCKKLQSFPKWMRKLNSLQQLVAEGCSENLYERCKNPYGEDWPNIQHIPNISVNIIN